MSQTAADQPAGPQSAASGLAPQTQEFLKALGSPTRQRIMMLFARGAEMSVGEVAERAGISQATASGGGARPSWAPRGADRYGTPPKTTKNKK
ncbi:ArsR/SmtB family transcription factor, partial [Micromonospora chersina]